MSSSRLDRKIIFIFGIGLIYFGLSNLILFSHLSLPTLPLSLGNNIHVVSGFVKSRYDNFDSVGSTNTNNNTNTNTNTGYSINYNNYNTRSVSAKNLVTQITWNSFHGAVTTTGTTGTSKTTTTTIQSDKKTESNNQTQTFYKIPFPQSIFNEDWEYINHPAIDLVPSLKQQANDTIRTSNKYKILSNQIQVPKFWNPPFFNGDVRRYLGNYGQQLITPQQAKMIGSFTMPIKDYDEQEPEITEEEEKAEDDKYVIVTKKLVIESPPKKIDPLETIFIYIASYRDSTRCKHTLEQIFIQAAYPERIRVAIINQIDEKTDSRCAKAKPDQSCTGSDYPENILCQYSHLIDEYILDAKLAVGPMFARHIGNRMYRGEYFVMQTDAHMEFINDWDTNLINQWKATNNEMAVLTSTLGDVQNHYNLTTGWAIKETKTKMCNTDFVKAFENNNDMVFLAHGQQPSGYPESNNNGEPILQPLWAAGFSFARGHFIVQVPYDQYLPMIVKGEEHNIGLRGFTYGYDYFSPQQSVLFHYYSGLVGNRKVNNFWEHSLPYTGVIPVSKKRLLGITQMLKSSDHVEWNNIEETKYGLGQVRKVKKFLDTFGIDLDTKSVDHRLCQFVGAPMNRMFLPHLRSDRMGIDYDKIQINFKDIKVIKGIQEMNEGSKE